MCYACIFGLDDSKPSEKSQGTSLLWKFFPDSFGFNNYIERIESRRLSDDMCSALLCLSLQLMQAEPHKLDFRSDPLARLPGAGGLGPLGTIGGGLPPTHELTRPPSLFPATGA